MDDKINLRFVPKDLGYTSPINITEGVLKQVREEVDGHILYSIEREIGVLVDKQEMIKALKYDRGQYAKGFKAGYARAIEVLKKERSIWEEVSDLDDCYWTAEKIIASYSTAIQTLIEQE